MPCPTQGSGILRPPRLPLPPSPKIRDCAEKLAAHPEDLEAIAALEALLEAPEERIDAARALVPVYERAGDDQQLVRALDALAAATDHDSEKTASLRRIADIQRKLQQPHLAFAALARALEATPADPVLQQLAEEAAVEADAVETLVEVLSDQLERTSATSRAAIHLKLAALNEQRLSNPEAALEQLRKAVAAAPRELAAFEGLRRLHTDRHEWAALAEVLEKLAKLQNQFADQLTTWRAAAKLHEEKLFDEESSLQCWLRVLDLAPDDREALEAIHGLSTALDRPAELARALSRERAAATGERRWALALQLAELQATRLNLPDEAAACCREVLSAQPAHPEARALLERWLPDPGRLGAAALWALDAALERTNEHGRRVELLQARADRAPASEQAALAKAIEQITAKLPANPTQSLLRALQAFEEGADRLRRLPELLRLAEQADALEELAEAVEAGSEEAEDEGEVAELLRFVARLRERLKQPQAAAVLWNDLLAARPDDGEALDQLSKIYKATGDAKNAAEVCLRKSRVATGPAEMIDRLIEAATFFEDAGANDEAIHALEESLALRADPRALRALNRLLSDTSMAGLHARVLGDLAKLEPASAQGKLHLRRGQVLASSDPVAAVAAFAQALRSGGVDAEAIALLHQLLATSARNAAAQALEPVYRDRHEHLALAEVIEALLEGTRAAPERLARLTEVASLYEQAAEPRAALGARLRAFALGPSDERARADLERLSGALGAQEELLAAYEEKLERGQEPNSGPLWRRVAELHDGRGQRDQAAAAWDQAALKSPADAALLRAYADRCRAQGDLTRLAAVLRRQVEAGVEPARHPEMLLELARIAQDSLFDDAKAAWAYEELSFRSPRDRQLLASLQRLYERSQDGLRLAEVLARDLQLARESGSPETVSLALRLAQLKLDRAKDDAGAFELLRGVLRLQPKNPEAVAGLVRLASTPGPLQDEAARAAAPMLDTLGDHSALVQLLESQVSAQADAAERARLWRQISDLHAGPLKDAESALLAVARALREAPADAALLGRCIALAEATGATEELCALLEEVADAQPRGPARGELYRALAKARAAAGEHDEAIDAWSEVHFVFPADPEAQHHLEALLEKAGRQAELAALLQQRAETAPPTERPAALLALAAAREKLGQLDAAAETLQTLYALTRGLDALGSLERVLGKLSRHRERAEVLGRIAAATPDAKGKNERVIQQAKTLVAAQELELAAGLFTEALARAPADDRVVAELVALAGEPRVRAKVAEALEPVYRDEGHRWQRLAVVEVLVANAAPGRERTLRNELAAIYEALGEPRQAFVERLRLVVEKIDDEAGRAEVERLALSANLEEELVAAYEDLLEKNPPAAVVLPLRRTVARLYSGRLASPAPAARMWEEVALLDPGSLEPLRALADIYRKAANHSHLAQVLRRQVPLLPDVDAQIDALTELAGLAEDALGDWSLAADAYRQVLQRTPQDLDALRSLSRMLGRLGLHQELSAVLERQLASAVQQQRPDEAADTELRLGQLALGPLGRPRDALDYFSRALQRRPDEAAAVQGLETLLVRAQELQAPAAAILEKVYRRRSDLPKLAEALELQLSAANAERETALLEELSKLREGLGDHGRAYLARRELFTRDPADARVRAELERLAELASRLDDLAGLYRQQLAQPLSEPLAVELWRHVAALHQRLGQRPRAAEAWEEVARRRQSDPEPLAALCALYREERAFAQLPRLLRRRADLETSIAGQVALLLELADLAELQLHDPALAVDSCKAAFARAPADARAATELERLLEGNRRFEELCELLLGQTRRAEAQGDEPLELALRVRLAKVRHRALEDDGAALDLLEEVLRRAPDHAEALSTVEAIMRSGRPAADEAAALLEPLYEKSEAWAELVEVLQIRAAASVGAVRAGFLHRLGDVQEMRLGAPAAAIDTLSNLLRGSPGDAAALERLLALAELAKAEGKVAALLAEVVPQVPSEAARGAMLRPLAKLREKLGDPAGALESWRALLALRPGDDEALEATVHLLEISWRWGELVEVLEQRLSHAVKDSERAALLARIGAVRDDSLGDAKAAHAAFRRVLELSPEDLPALVRLDKLCGQLGRFTELAEVLARRIRVEPAARVALQLRLAEVRRAHLDDAAGALPLLGEVLQTDPRHLGALAELQHLVELEENFGPASEMLLSGYRQLGDASKLAAFLDARAALAGDAARRRALWLELGKLRLERQDDPDLGFLAYARAFRETPADGALRSKVIELAATAGTEDALAALLEEVLPLLDAAAIAETSLALAEIYEGPLKDADRAAACYRRALDSAPAAAPRALAGLDRVLEGLGSWAELLPVLEARLAAARAAAERIGLLLRIASTAGEKLLRADRAAQALREVVELEPGHLGAARSLEALYERTGQGELLLGILEHLLGRVPARERQGVRLKLARLCGEAKAERAVALCRELLTEDPLHPEAFALLVGHLETARRHDELGQLLRARRSVTLDPKELAGLEFQLGELSYRRLDRPVPAIPHYREVLDRAPRHLGALEALAEIYEALGQRRELAQALGDLAAAREDLDDRRHDLLRRAEVLVELGSRDLALAAAREAIGLQPREEGELERLRLVLQGIDALPEMARVLAKMGEVQVREKRVAAAVKTLLELSAARERLSELPAAAAALENILAIEPGQRTAYDKARALYARLEDWAALAALLSRFLPHLPEGERPGTLDELAEVHEARLGEAAEAFGFAREALRLDPKPATRRERAERLAKTLGRQAELATLYAEILGRDGFGASGEALSLALAAIEDEALDRVEDAEKTLKTLLEHDPGNAQALDAMVHLFARRGLHGKHAAALELKLEATAGADPKAVLLRELAQLHEERLRDPKAAANALRRLLELRKDAESAALLAALHRRHQQWNEALDALQRMLKLSTALAARAKVQLEIAELYERQLGDPEAAVTGYGQALAYEPGSAEAFHALERLYKKLDRPAELLRAYEQRLAQTSDPSEQLALLYQSAELWEKRNASQQADRCLERVLQHDPRAVRALEGLERLRRAGERWTALSEALARHVEVADAPAEKAVLCTSLGALHRGQLRDEEGASRWWKRAVELVPEHRPALHALAELHQHQGRWLEATRLLTREAELEKDPEARADLEHQAGQLREERLRDLPGATSSYQRALAANPIHLPSLRRLRALHHKAGDWPGYEQTLVQEAEHAPTAPDRAAAALDLGRHLETRARDASGAKRWYEHALSNRPDALEAALPLSELLVSAAEWSRASEVLQVAVALLERAGPPKRIELVRRLCKLGDVQRQLGQSGLALESYERTLAVEPIEQGALRGSAELLEEAGNTSEAADQYAALLHHHEQSLRAPERAELRVRLAGLLRKLGAIERALPMVEKALEADPVHASALRLAVELSDATAAWEKAILFRQRLAGVVGGDERFRLLVEMGSLAQDKLSSPTRAIQGYVKALELHPDSLEVLERLQAAYSSAGQPAKAAETLEALLGHPQLGEEPRRRYTLALADLLGKTLHEEDRAVAVLEKALDRAPDFLPALQLIEALLSKSRRWKPLCECYERMVRRLDRQRDGAASQALLWRTIAELRRKRLEDAAGAFEAYRAGAALVPGDAEAQEALADLAIELPEHEAEAVAAYVRAIPTTQNPTRICGALARVAEKHRDADSMFLAASAAVLAGQPGPYEERLVRELGKYAQAPARIRSPVTDDHWRRHLLHPSLRGPLGQLMALIHEQAGAKFAASLGDFKLHPKKHRIELGEPKDPALKQLRLVARALGFDALNLYSPHLAGKVAGKIEKHPDENVGLRVNPTAPLSLFLGEPLLREADLAGLCAHIGSTVALLRPELSMAVLLPPDELAPVIDAALTFADPSFEPRADPKLVKAEQKRLSKALTPQGKSALTSLATALLREREGNDYRAYLDGVRHTVARAALLVSGDFTAVKSRVLPTRGSRVQTSMRELIAFAIGGDLHALRVETGSQLATR